jgi:hypothetical protein
VIFKFVKSSLTQIDFQAEELKIGANYVQSVPSASRKRTSAFASMGLGAERLSGNEPVADDFKSALRREWVSYLSDYLHFTESNPIEFWITGQKV